MLALNQIHQGDCLGLMAQLPAGSIDLTVTSPPYDGLRTYNGYSFDFEAVAAELYRVTKLGGVVVWVVGDATVKGSETGTSFRQALHFMQCGFSLADTMIYHKPDMAFSRYGHRKYPGAHEYMFILSKGPIRTFNLIKDRKNKYVGAIISATVRQVNGTTKPSEANGKAVAEIGCRTNVWGYSTGKGKSAADEIAYQHPAIFPEKLAADHILSWSNPGDVVMDPFSGSGTTAKMALVHDRKYLGFEISSEYAQISRVRLASVHPALDFGSAATHE